MNILDSSVGSLLLSKLSKEELLRTIHVVGADHRRALARLIAVLAEVARRGFHRELACSSLWDFCVRRLGMSEDGASRRAGVAKLALRFPLVLEKLERGEVHLSGLLLLRPYLTHDNHGE